MEKIKMNESYKEIGKVFYCNMPEYIGDYFSIPVMDYRVIKEIMQPYLNVELSKHLQDFIYTLEIKQNKVLAPDGKPVYDLKLDINFNLHHKWEVTLTNIQIYGKGIMKNETKSIIKPTQHNN